MGAFSQLHQEFGSIHGSSCDHLEPRGNPEISPLVHTAVTQCMRMALKATSVILRRNLQARNASRPRHEATGQRHTQDYNFSGHSTSAGLAWPSTWPTWVPTYLTAPHLTPCLRQRVPNQWLLPLLLAGPTPPARLKQSCPHPLNRTLPPSAPQCIWVMVTSMVMFSCCAPCHHILGPLPCEGL